MIEVSDTRPHHGRTSGVAGCVAYLLAFLALVVSAGAAEKPSEYQIKAAFLYNFANFTTWPDSAFKSEDSPLVIAVLGEDPFHGALDFVESKPTADGRMVEIVHAKSLATLPQCHLLFISESRSDYIASIVNHVKGNAILTIADESGACENGVMICFFNEDNRIRFHTNLDAIESSNLRIDPRVLKLGREIGGKEQ
ncbi:MAG: YfiR family protein [Calditrichaeota bacterium]|nr:YfiR family protein [Calditrichota bacterium]MCB9367625.1 YfiR family protein [Calditrichota bacterium]